MLPKKLYAVLGENKDLGNKLHTHYVYYSGKKEQVKAKENIASILEDYSDKKLLGLAYDATTKKLLREFISLKKESHWEKVLQKILKGLYELLTREIENAAPIPRASIRMKINKLPIYDKDDILMITENLFIWDYINVEKSFHGKRIGTDCVLFLEKLAKELGFSRFSVEYPNRGYWIKKLNYQIPYRYRLGSGKYQYTLEGYKEV